MANRSDRKKQLIAQGAIYRAEAMLAKQAVQESLKPEAMAKSALHQAMLIGMAALNARNIAGLPGINLQRILPLLMGGVSALSQNKPLVKTVLRGAAVAGSVAGLVRLFMKKNKRSDGAASSDAFGDPEQ